MMELSVAIEEPVSRLRERALKLIHQIELPDEEKELLVKEALFDFDKLHDELAAVFEEHHKTLELLREENKLTRSFLGQDANELRARLLSLKKENDIMQREFALMRDELEASRERIVTLDKENEALKKELETAEQKIKDARAENIHNMERQVSAYYEEYDSLNVRLKELEQKINDLKGLLDTQAVRLTQERQAEITNLQKQLLQEMDKTLRSRQELQWAEEELFSQGVAYKLRAKVQGITGRLQFALERLKVLEPFPKSRWTVGVDRLRLLLFGPGELRDAFSTIKADLHQMLESVEEYVALTTRRAPVKSSVNVPDVVTALVSEFFAERRPGIALEKVIEEPLPDVSGDAQLLSLSLRALVVNAVESLPQGKGRIKIRVYFQTSSGEIHIEVQDTGEDIKPELQGKIFQPFFTTKPGHRGLGLARAKRFISWHNGSISLVKSDGQGNLFLIKLPATK